MFRYLFFVVAFFQAATPQTASAAFVITYNNVQTFSGGNQFAPSLINLGATGFSSSGFSVTLSQPGNIRFQFYGRESFNRAEFRVGNLSYNIGQQWTDFPTDSRFARPDGLYYNAPTTIGEAEFNSATFDPSFSNAPFGGQLYPPVMIGHPQFGVAFAATPGSEPGMVETNTLWMMYDDHILIYPGSGESSPSRDGDFDDFIVKAIFEPFGAPEQYPLYVPPPKPPLPEPATWLMMIMGFGLVGLSLRNRRAHAIAYRVPAEI